ncbi:hypothetical protein [Maribacter sp. ACAM166]|uniref:hypothetical protein n=1 Tax=Maribacter sp. ACAM166 TaxID=2508996 RepID=UPI0010FEB660|nr:hypothetical protein [Maribacter sp. ACAM166]TLP73247.1 hypothetical protein ES765_17440 [Maribacter sp. ACAM166]
MNEITSRKKLVNKLDKLLLERLPDYVSDELKWIRKEFGDDEISEFLLREDNYYLKNSERLKQLNLIEIHH